MKHSIYYIVALIILSCTSLVAQVGMHIPTAPEATIDTLKPAEIQTEPGLFEPDPVYSYVDELPYFKFISNSTIEEFIKENFFCSEELKKQYTGKYIFIECVIEMDGSVSNVKVLPGKGLNPKLDAEALRVTKLTSGKWGPAKINGKPIRYRHRIKFTM